tara:strand:+ start:232 stop:690 length:459 start_codon:yes stop_codon:yes gene_type:complete
VAYDYLSENAVPLNAFATKYAEGISKHYENISSKSLKIVSEEMLKFLNELEAGEKAEVILNNYSFFLIFYNKFRMRRRKKTWLYNIMSGSSKPSYDGDKVLKSFKAYVYGYRSNSMPKAPTGWDLEYENDLDVLTELIKCNVTVEHITKSTS